ncbi:MAG: hypothetical protein CMJ52_01430 [Planctomycetaceae bacterium]|nr:hypothetical protein [Planctomycetaceae bacterium]
MMLAVSCKFISSEVKDLTKAMMEANLSSLVWYSILNLPGLRVVVFNKSIQRLGSNWFFSLKLNIIFKISK